MAWSGQATHAVAGQLERVVRPHVAGTLEWDTGRSLPAGAHTRTRTRETVLSQEVGRDIAEWRARRAGTLMRAHSGSALSASC